MTGVPLIQRVTFVLGTSAGGMGAHVRMLAAGLSDHGIAVSVIGPSSADTRFSFSALSAVSFSAVEIGERPRVGDLASIRRLRRLLLAPAAAGSTPHDSARDSGKGRSADNGPEAGSREEAGGRVVHAHGLRAGALTVLALSLAPRKRRPGVVVTVHNAPTGGGVTGLTYRLLERVVARGADPVLCVSPDLEHRMRAARAHRVDRAVIAAPSQLSDPAAVRDTSSPQGSPTPLAQRTDSGPVPAIEGTGRPMVLAVGRLAPQKGFAVLLEAAAAWRDLDPAPRLAIAGDGPLAGELKARAAALGVDAAFLGHRDDVQELLAKAAVFVLPSLWEGQPLALQEAMRAGTPVVATRVGGVPTLTGEDAAVLVPPGDARALAGAVHKVLTDAPLAQRLRSAAAARAATLPTETDAVTAALNAYNSIRRGAGLR
jgi:glycosyltransferase involved in cell wall biosynthesis